MSNLLSDLMRDHGFGAAADLVDHKNQNPTGKKQSGVLIKAGVGGDQPRRTKRTQKVIPASTS